MTTCKVSLTASGTRHDFETAATCELIFEGKEEAKLTERQIRQLQDVCLAVVSQPMGLKSKSGSGRRRSQTGSATLRQLAKLYRAASRLPAFDLMHLQHLSRRLYQKPLEELSMLEVAGMTSTLNAVFSGMVELKEVLKTPDSAMNGHVGNRV